MFNVMNVNEFMNSALKVAVKVTIKRINSPLHNKVT